MYIEQLIQKIPPPSHNTVAVYKQITLLIPYYISSRLVTLTEVPFFRTVMPMSSTDQCKLKTISLS